MPESNADGLKPFEKAYANHPLNGERNHYENTTQAVLEKLCTRASQLTERFLATQQDPPTNIKPSIALHLFNFVQQYPQAKDFEAIQEVSRFHSLLEKEKHTQAIGDKSSIGIEVEVPKDFFPFKNENF